MFKFYIILRMNKLYEPTRIGTIRTPCIVRTYARRFFVVRILLPTAQSPPTPNQTETI